jgi:hypothetical protein
MEKALGDNLQELWSLEGRKEDGTMQLRDVQG